ncbi:transcriptional regulator, GntR family [Cribrihabitans marinus]|uniref:Transcriptional regulator, GntR family n=1 Tax=Cribrihabitans marinus TaxID=1227549 RepID=A0A1H7AFS6_9RHOB|nr:FadR/GntR family transcriptional regulator [Cribrihabitans marinus]GGH31529.1 GntR family transcriptional regulator [Cribrihabitans marinus]SEJ63796.1 transcriptional regulator, GntR family [Cribrihabitans marinus]
MDAADRIFDPIDHDSVAEAVVHQIEAMIVSGILKEGTRLPSEREMSELLKVSRPKLREALKNLEDQGLLKVRHGEGSFIAPLTGTALTPAFLDLYARHPAAFFDYLEYRREQEAFAARLAAQRATQADKDILAAILDEMDRTMRSADFEAAQVADINFHAAIVDASNNSTLIHMMASIYDLTRRGVFYNRKFLRTIDGAGTRLFEQHSAIAQAIFDGDSAGADAAARAHIDFVELSFREGSQREAREKVARKRKILMGGKD